MREIKFRGLSINGEWYHGLLSISQGYNTQPPKGCYISNKAGQPWAYQVRPETVGQYANLKDSNGKEIYEGDILKREAHSYLHVVKWMDNSSGFHLAWVFDSINAGMDIRIIGNIYENPELLT